MTTPSPILVALPLGQETDDILAAATELGLRLERPILVVHALDGRRLEGEQAQLERIATAKERVDRRLAPLREAGLKTRIEAAVERPADLVIETAQRACPGLIVTGGGRPATVRRWLVGSVAEAVVYRATVPVWVARGAPPVGQPVVCPVDLSPQSRLGLKSAIRMARAFGSPLRVMTVVPPPHEQARDAVRDHDLARDRLEKLLAERHLEGLDVSVVVVGGSPAEEIVDATGDAGLLVVGSRGFDPLIPEWLGPVTSRALRSGQCNTLTVREVDVDLRRREHAIAGLAYEYQTAKELLDEDRAAEAFPILESIAERAPANATIQEAYARALDRLDRGVEARGRREIAAIIRRRIGAA